MRLRDRQPLVLVVAPGTPTTELSKWGLVSPLGRRAEGGEGQVNSRPRKRPANRPPNSRSEGLLPDGERAKRRGRVNPRPRLHPFTATTPFSGGDQVRVFGFLTTDPIGSCPIRAPARTGFRLGLPNKPYTANQGQFWIHVDPVMSPSAPPGPESDATRPDPSRRFQSPTVSSATEKYFLGAKDSSYKAPSLIRTEPIIPVKA